MSSQHSESVPERSLATAARFQELVPLPDVESCVQLGHEALQWATAHGGDDLIVLVDADTAGVDGLDALLTGLGDRVAVIQVDPDTPSSIRLPLPGSVSSSGSGCSSPERLRFTTCWRPR